MTTEQCDFRRFFPLQELQFPVKTAAKRKKVRCPRCKKRLRLRTVPDHQDGGVAFYTIPPHRTTMKRFAKQLRLPGIKR